jgi:acyl carrier protein
MAYNHLTTLKDALSEVLERPVADLTPDMQIDRAFDLDSVMFVQFLLAVEDRVPGLRFDPEVLAEASFNNVASLLTFLDGVTTQAAVA